MTTAECKKFLEKLLAEDDNDDQVKMLKKFVKKYMDASDDEKPKKAKRAPTGYNIFTGIAIKCGKQMANVGPIWATLSDDQKKEWKIEDFNKSDDNDELKDRMKVIIKNAEKNPAPEKEKKSKKAKSDSEEDEAPKKKEKKSKKVKSDVEDEDDAPKKKEKKSKKVESEQENVGMKSDDE